MARPDKAASVAEITEDLRSSTATVVTEYRGLKVSEMKELRRSLGGDVKYAVVKNTLTKIAAREAGLADLDALLEGPTAIAFVKGDPVVAAKGLRDFGRTHPALVIKGGVLESRAVSPDEIRKLADLESREVLLAKLAGAMKASLSQAVGLFAAPLSQAARLMAALQEQKDAEPQAAAEVETQSPATEEAPTDDTAADGVGVPVQAEEDGAGAPSGEADAETEATPAE
jgi:large subunit ribosomal protein L10